MNLKIVSLCSFILFFTGVSLAQDGQVLQLSLEEALKIAQQQSYQIRIAKSQVGQAKGQNLESWSGFLPHVSLSENYIKSNDPVTVFSLKLKQGIFSQEDFSLSALNNPKALDNFTTAFQVQQPVFNLDAIYGKAAASAGVQARKQALARTQEGIALEVKRAYYGLILARQNLQAIEGALRSAEAHVQDAKAAFEQGMINRADYLSAEVRMAELKEQRIVAAHQINNASDGLKLVMGLEEEAVVVPSDSLTLPETVPDAHNLDQAVATRSDLRALEFQHKAASRNAWMKRSGWIPNLNAFGGVEWNASEAFSKDASNWAFGFQLQWKPFQGLGNFGRSRQASAQAQEVEVRLREAGEKARMEIRQAERSVQAAEQRIEVGKTAVDQAQISLHIVEERFKQGLEKTSDLLDKEVALTHARLRLLQAKHDYAVAVSGLQFALGD